MQPKASLLRIYFVNEFPLDFGRLHAQNPPYTFQAPYETYAELTILLCHSRVRVRDNSCIEDIELTRLGL